MRRNSSLKATTRGRRLATALAAALLLTACGGGDAGSEASGEDAPDLPEDADELVEDADELADDIDDIAEDAEQQLDAAGIETDTSDAYAEVDFQGETLRIPADPSFGCLILEDGGSDGVVDFDGTDDAGNELVLSWTGEDEPVFFLLDLTLADGSEWYPTDAAFDVTISGSNSAVVSTTLNSFDGTEIQEADIEVRPTCG